MSLYITLIILFLIVAIFLQVDFVYYIVYVCVGIWLWARWLVPRQLKRIEVSRQNPQRVFWNERFSAQITVHNEGWLRLPWLLIRDSVPLELRIGSQINDIVTLRGREKATLSVNLAGKRRGRFTIGPLRVSTSDVFGLGKTRVRMFPTTDIIVYPRIHTLKSLGLPSKLPFGTLPSEERLFADPSRPVGVREFRSGDSLRSMNWKVSAHTEKLMVRTYQPAVAQEVLLALNLYESDYQRKDRLAYVEWGIELAASLAAHLAQQKQGVVLAPMPVDPAAAAGLSEGLSRLPEDGQGRRPTRAGIETILEALAQLDSQNHTPLEAWLPEACREVQWGTTILVITPTASQTTTEQLHQLVRTGRNPVLIISQPMADRDRLALIERGRRLGFAVFYVPRVYDLAIWQSE